MRLNWMALAAAAVSCSSPDSSDSPAQITRSGTLEITDAYAPAPASADVGSLYFTVINHGGEADTLVAIETSAGGTASLHDMVRIDGTMRMQATGAVEVAPSHTLRMAPGGYHVMIEHVTVRPEVGDTLDVIVTFARAGQVELRVPILTYSDVARLLEDPGDRRH
ncbi:MAG: copper chaperone PCu(A)C [Gemmatimonadota bacterium]|nr:MAG: copper chaperone PCu(A)C [Gemmatimonadota bacterium]